MKLIRFQSYLLTVLQFQVQDQDRENSEITASGAAVLVFCLLSAALNMFLLVQVCFNKGNSSSYSNIWNVRKKYF